MRVYVQSDTNYTTNPIHTHTHTHTHTLGNLLNRSFIMLYTICVLCVYTKPNQSKQNNNKIDRKVSVDLMLLMLPFDVMLVYVCVCVLAMAIMWLVINRGGGQQTLDSLMAH